MSTFPTYWQEKDFTNWYEQLTNYSHICILGHENPDLDCLMSQLALAEWLKRVHPQGQSINVCSKGPFQRPEIKKYQNQFLETLPEFNSAYALVLVDCHHIQRTGFTCSVEDLPIFVIDHHVVQVQHKQEFPYFQKNQLTETKGQTMADKTQQTEGDSSQASAVIFNHRCLIDPLAPSATVLIFQLMQAVQKKIDPLIAHYLFLGLCSDTDFFHFLRFEQGFAYKIGEQLVAYGQIDPKKIYHQLYEQNKWEQIRFANKLVLRAESLKGLASGQVIYTYELMGERKEGGVEEFNKNLVYDQIRSIEQNQVMLYVKQEAKGCSGSLRSRQWNIQPIAEYFGGGGHHNASGFYSVLNWDTLIEQMGQQLLELAKSQQG